MKHNIRVFYEEVRNLFEGEEVVADRWMTSSDRGLGNYTPILLIGSEQGLQKIKILVDQLEHGVFP